MKQGKSEVIVVLDRSGSMRGSESDMEGGFQTFLAKQKNEPGECYVSLYQFDTEFEAVYEGRNVKDVTPFKLEPRGSTALYDAVGQTIDRVGKRLAETAEDERPESVIIMVITDGGENASRKYDSAMVQQMTKHQTEKYNWKFLYLGADQDAFAVGSTLGVSAAQSLNYSKSARGVSNTWTLAASGVSCMRSAPTAASYCFSEQDRTAAVEQ